MASTARANLVDPTVVGVYHCWNSCTRQDFNLGFNCQTGEDRGRREYVHGVQERLAALYGIDVAFYATLDNHLSYVYNREAGLLTRGEIKLEDRAAKKEDRRTGGVSPRGNGMALVLNHQTAAEFAARFWVRCTLAYDNDRPEFERLVWWIWSRVTNGDLTNDQVRLSFNSHFGRSLNPAQWNAFVTSRLVPIKDRYLARLAEAPL